MHNYSPFEELKFSTNNADFGYYTVKLINGLRFRTKTFMPEKNFENIELPALYFDRLNPFFGLMESIIYHFHLK